ncbi:1-deoxy-D-xylulose-5-phosphate reductoisomerase [Schaalia sp. lx-260]|uniref:1-deoxy-D-xylulose-5-phosphate reductoisomerase n=1 Tax=Schaalia sp. lx-260 TaxID=2899082 RepID=UPI001E5E2A8F|nr:1-deoxy-D-xylulose-5-phosphate reductoisomerase [Schaalia sp. lx-260]MCD4549326.1 1-deoxy-D-xylulose-5-phosphate reductoisomerase [Schaalia sp. lx-260]
MRDIVLLGSTGSIGTQALDIVARNPEEFRLRGLAAGGAHLELLARQVCDFCVEVVAVATYCAHELRAIIEEKRQDFSQSIPMPTILEGPDAATELAGMFPDAVVLNGITGGVGLGPTLAALQAGSTLALANKESLVVGGPLVRAALQRPGQIVPVDSEHSAIAQALRSGIHEKGLTSPRITGRSEVAELVLTASGGPFRGRLRDELRHVTPAQALDHPTWNMGPVVTINSSTLVNKGLELIEAHLLFDVPAEHIQTVIHPQSIVHSMVTWNDGATIVQASPPDMHLPIALGMTWPQRLKEVEIPIRWDAMQSWIFEPVDHQTFPAIQLARYAVSASATHPAVYNAANEVFVEAFLRGSLPYLAIVDLLGTVLEAYEGVQDPNIDDVMEAQRWAVSYAQQQASHYA